MISFSSDYTKGAHPQILKRLAETNLEQNPGYGTDDHCRIAADKIKEACGLDDAQVFFLVGKACILLWYGSKGLFTLFSRRGHIWKEMTC